MAALTWAETERPRGELVTNASMVFTLLVINFNLDVKESVHIAGEENWRCDKLSRLSESEEGVVSALAGMGLEGTAVIDLQENNQVQILLASCNPVISFDGDDAFLDFWRAVKDALKEIAREATNNSATVHAITKLQV